MNLCRSCGEDFGSVAAFDAHRVGSHSYLLREGLLRVPPVEDGRRCLSPREMLNTTRRDGSSTFSRNARGSWSMDRDVRSARAAFA